MFLAKPWILQKQTVFGINLTRLILVCSTCMYYTSIQVYMLICMRHMSQIIVMDLLSRICEIRSRIDRMRVVELSEEVLVGLY